MPLDLKKKKNIYIRVEILPLNKISLYIYKRINDCLEYHLYSLISTVHLKKKTLETTFLSFSAAPLHSLLFFVSFPSLFFHCHPHLLKKASSVKEGGNETYFRLLKQGLFGFDFGSFPPANQRSPAGKHFHYPPSIFSHINRTMCPKNGVVLIFVCCCLDP